MIFCTSTLYYIKQAAFAACLICFSCGLSFEAEAQSASKRVVSLNLCTDILALSLAEPGQIISLSNIATDPQSSPVAEQAQSYHHNHAGLEEILSLKPDLVLASIYTSPDKIAVLENAGIRVERFGAAQNFTAIRQQILQMGDVLGQQTKAQAQIQQFDETLAALYRFSTPKTAILYEPNGLTSGSGSLADETLHLFGLTNLGTKFDGTATGRIGLETLVQFHPDLIIVPELREKPALAYQNYTHPVMTALQRDKISRQISIPMRYWSCGSIYTLEAVKLLSAALKSFGD